MSIYLITLPFLKKDKESVIVSSERGSVIGKPSGINLGSSGDEDDDIGELICKKTNSGSERRTSSSSTCSSTSTWSSSRRSSGAGSSHRSRLESVYNQ